MRHPIQNHLFKIQCVSRTKIDGWGLAQRLKARHSKSLFLINLSWVNDSTWNRQQTFNPSSNSEGDTLNERDAFPPSPTLSFNQQIPVNWFVMAKASWALRILDPFFFWKPVNELLRLWFQFCTTWCIPSRTIQNWPRPTVSSEVRLGHGFSLVFIITATLSLRAFHTEHGNDTIPPWIHDFQRVAQRKNCFCFAVMCAEPSVERSANRVLCKRPIIEHIQSARASLSSCLLVLYPHLPCC